MKYSTEKEFLQPILEHGMVCVVKLKARREDVEVHLLLQETSGAFSLTKRKEGI